jgi:flavin-dependent dehydrogenase
MARMWDVIVVGTRAAGATTAMLLARAGLQVPAVDQTSFPSDTLSSHQVQVPGVARLARWRLLAKLDAAGTPPTRRVRFDSDGIVLEGSLQAYDGVDALYSPRRTVLDALLVDAARAAGAEVWENVQVKEVTAHDGVVTGISGIASGRRQVTMSGRLLA